MFRQDFTCPALLKNPTRASAYRAITRSGQTFQSVQLTPRQATGLFRFRSPLLAEPQGTAGCPAAPC